LLFEELLLVGGQLCVADVRELFWRHSLHFDRCWLGRGTTYCLIQLLENIFVPPHSLSSPIILTLRNRTVLAKIFRHLLNLTT
jgi:hypothetical protein